MAFSEFGANPVMMRNWSLLAARSGIVYCAVATHLAHKAGFTKPMAQTGAVTLIQHFGSALNLNIHFHMLFLDGVYTGGSNGRPMWFRQVKAPNRAELTRLTHIIAHRVGRYLERQGLVERDTGNVYLTPEAVDASDDDPSSQLLGSSITYRIAIGPQQGRKVFTLQTLPNFESDNLFSGSVGEAGGFSLHAGVATKANERCKLERLCRYITRPAVSTKRLSMTRNGRKTGKALNDQTPAEKQASMTWAKRLKRVFDIDIETCSECGGDVKIISSIEDPAVIRKILAHLDDNATSAATALLPDCRASPSLPVGLFD